MQEEAQRQPTQVAGEPVFRGDTQKLSSFSLTEYRLREHLAFTTQTLRRKCVFPKKNNQTETEQLFNTILSHKQTRVRLYESNAQAGNKGLPTSQEPPNFPTRPSKTGSPVLQDVTMSVWKGLRDTTAGNFNSNWVALWLVHPHQETSQIFHT